MKRRFTIPALTMICFMTLAASAYAGLYDRLDRQHRRIHHGIDSGRLTRSEANRLLWQHERIRHLGHHFLNDGYLNRTERRSLDRKLDRASDRIYRYKHNSRHRHDYRYDRGRRCR